MEIRRVSPRSLAARTALSLARPGPGQSSCLSITQVVRFFTIRRITGTAICTPLASGWSCTANGTEAPSVSATPSK
jgi:hypothetical protein